MKLVHGRCRVIETSPTEAGLELTIEALPEVLAELERELEKEQKA